MRAHVDQKDCIGCGLCVATAPAIFMMNEEGKAQAMTDTTEANQQSLMEAMEGCPVGAIQKKEHQEENR